MQGVLVEEGPVGDDEDQDDESKDSIDDEHDLEGRSEVTAEEGDDGGGEHTPLHYLLRELLALPIHGVVASSSLAMENRSIEGRVSDFLWNSRVSQKKLRDSISHLFNYLLTYSCICLRIYVFTL